MAAATVSGPYFWATAAGFHGWECGVRHNA